MCCHPWQVLVDSSILDNRCQTLHLCIYPDVWLNHSSYHTVFSYILHKPDLQDILHLKFKNIKMFFRESKITAEMDVSPTSQLNIVVNLFTLTNIILHNFTPLKVLIKLGKPSKKNAYFRNCSKFPQTPPPPWLIWNSKVWTLQIFPDPSPPA